MRDYLLLSALACAVVVMLGALRWWLATHDTRPDNYEAAKRRELDRLADKHFAEHEAYWRLKAQQAAAQRRFAKRLNNSDK